MSHLMTTRKQGDRDRGRTKDSKNEGKEGWKREREGEEQRRLGIRYNLQEHASQDLFL